MDYSHYKQLEFKRKFWKIFGASITISDLASQGVVGYIQMKAWRWRGDIRLYRDESLQQEVFHIAGRQIVSFNMAYDVFDTASGQQLFALRRRGIKSAFVRDHWDLLDVQGNPFGDIQETSSTLAVSRRWLELLPFGEIIGLIFAFVPQTYEIRTNDATGSPRIVGRITHRKNPIVVKMLLDTTNVEATVDARVNVAATAMLSIMDASKNS